MSNDNARNRWTDNEKLGFILQLVAKLPKIPWDELELPQGRTQKACQVMLDKEKQKIRDATTTTPAKSADNPSESPQNSKKRKAAGGPANQKATSPRATKTAVVKQEEHEDEAYSEDTSFVL